MPWPPSVNSLYFQGKTHGQKFLSKKGREYKAAIRDLLGSDDLDPMLGSLEVTIHLYPPDSRVRDLDNYVKPVLDGLKFLELIEDDSQIDALYVYKNQASPKYNKGLVWVQVSSLDMDPVHSQKFLDLIEQYIELLDQEGKDRFIKRSKAYDKRFGGDA